LYLVLVGPFPDQYSAINYRERLQQDGFEAFIARLPDVASPTPTAYTVPTEHTPIGETNRYAETTTVAGESAPRLAPPSPSEGRKPKSSPDTQIFVQVAAFRAEGNALSFADEFVDPEHHPMVQYAEDGWFRVVFGPFASREAAIAYREKLSAQGRESVLRVP
jgi:cell division septation protein DedD